MYKELATIRRGKVPSRFLVYDGRYIFIMDMERMKTEAAAMNVDTLGYDEGLLVPVLRNEVKWNGKTKRAARKYRKGLRNMTFEDFVDHDILFQEDHIRTMNESETPVICASVCSLFEGRKGSGNSVIQMLIAFYSPDKNAMYQLRKELGKKGNMVRISKDYGDMMLVSISLHMNDFSYELLSIQQGAGVDFLFSMDTFDNMDKRMDRLMKNMGFFTGKIMKTICPSESACQQVKRSIENNTLERG